MTLRLLDNQRLPFVDLIANYGMQGLGGTQFIRQGSGLGSSVIGTIPGGYSNAFNSLAGRDYPTWTMQLNVAYPIGASAADAQYARGRVQRNQSAAQLRALELQVATEVTNAALQVENGLKRYEAADAARMLAQTRLEAEQSRFDVGPVDELLRRAGTARSRDRAELGAARAARLPAGARGLPARAGSTRQPRHRHHHHPGGCGWRWRRQLMNHEL